jgi:antitoxin VapB
MREFGAETAPIAQCAERHSRPLGAGWPPHPCLWRDRSIDISGIYLLTLNFGAVMAKTGTAKLFKHGRSQAVRLPKDFRLPGTEVRVRRVGRGVLLEPMERDIEDVKAVFAEIDRLGGADFLPEGRPEQPPMPPQRAVFDE